MRTQASYPLLPLTNLHCKLVLSQQVFPGSSDGEESACNAGDWGSIPGLGRSPEGGNGNPVQYSHLENSSDSEAWRATVHVVTKSCA